MPRYQYPELEATPQSLVPITSLETRHLKCRILIQPLHPTRFYALHLSPRTYLDRWGHPSRSNDDRTDCVVVTQIPGTSIYQIYDPLRCNIYFDPQWDFITFQNLNEFDSVVLEHLDHVEDGTRHGKLYRLEPFQKQTLDVGAWAIHLRSTLGVRQFQMIIYPRAHSISILEPGQLPDVVGFKRIHSRRTNNPDGNPDDDPNDSLDNLVPCMIPQERRVIRMIDNFGELRRGELARAATRNEKEYQIQRLESPAHRCWNSVIYKAKVDQFPNYLVAVKYVLPGAFRVGSWEREVCAFTRLRCDTIVRYFGADSRFSIICVEWIDSPDLGDQSWCSFIDHLFLGNEQDAVRVLTDMAKALEHLREHNIVNHDIKASNILYSRRNGAVLIDFGLAITNQTDDEAMTFNGGTAWYIEPNLAAGRHMPEDNKEYKQGRGQPGTQGIYLQKATNR
ncbi:kinase-like domain-containing protein [Nemania diffusa]|nr:kinase-like domain-containing protein [Nemania diffusa]